MASGYTSVITGSKTAHTYTGLPAGYYGIVFTTDTTSVVGVSYQSDNYACPYIAGFSDPFSVFTGCTSSSTSNLYTVGLPCLVNEPGTLRCTRCLGQYTLSNGQCLYDTNCGSRQYYSFGKCYDVNPDCDGFDAYKGYCFSCLSDKKEVINRTCVDRKGCPSGKHLVNGACIPENCSEVYSNGHCKTCISKAYRLDSNGACIAIDCGPDKYFSLSQNICTDMPANCNKINLST